MSCGSRLTLHLCREEHAAGCPWESENMPTVRLLFASFLILISPVAAQAGQVGVGDFGGGTQTTTFDGLGLPLYPNYAPLVIDGHTVTTDDGVFRYFAISLFCVANECIANNQDLGFIDVVLDDSYLRAGAFVTGLYPGWFVRADFYDPSDALLGSVVLSNPASAGPLFAGWEDAGGVARIRFVDLTPNSRLIAVDDVKVEGGVGPPMGEPVQIDIKPGDYPNAINPLSLGLVPVAILGSASFDGGDVDVSTLAFGPGGAAPVEPPGSQLVDVNEDGFTDLLSHYATPEIGLAIGDTIACVSGETLDATPFEACDDVMTSPACGIGFELAFVLPPLLCLYARRRAHLA